MSVAAADKAKTIDETLLAADATRDKRSMLIAQKSCGSHRYSSRVVVFLLRYLTKVLGIRLCEELDGSLLLVPDRSRDAPDWPPCASPDHYKERNTTRPAHRDAVSQTPERAAATALARRLPLATPSSAAPLLATSKTAFYASSVAPSMHWSSRRGARPRFGQLRPLLENNCAPCYTFQQPQYTRSSAADQTALAACKTLAQSLRAAAQSA